MRAPAWIARWLAACLALAALPACGPIEYISQVTRRASAEVETAHTLNAEKLAPYWYTLAIEYLHQARHEAAQSDFQAANRFGRKAEQAARTAQKMAKEKASEPGSSDEAPIDPSTEPPPVPVRRDDGEAVHPLPAPEDEGDGGRP